jgi:hypothetical protein
MFCALICFGVVGFADGTRVGDGEAEGLRGAETEAEGDDEPGPGIAPCTVSGSNTPDRTTANPATAMTATPMRTAMVRRLPQLRAELSEHGRKQGCAISVFPARRSCDNSQHPANASHGQACNSS